MINMSRAALSALVALGVAGGALTVAGPGAASAQAAEAKKPRPPKLSSKARKAIGEAQQLAAKNDLPGAVAKLKEGLQQEKLTAEDRYWMNLQGAEWAQTLQDDNLFTEMGEGALATGFAPEDAGNLLGALYGRALNRKDHAKAAEYLQKLSQLQPQRADLQLEQGRLYSVMKQPREAIAALNRAFEIGKATGQPVEEQWYKIALGTAADARLPEEIHKQGLALVTAYPSSTNWRDALILLRDSGKYDDQVNLDIMRLARAAGALNGERDYFEFAETSNLRGLPGEARAVLDEGVAKGMIDPGKPITRELNSLVNPKIAQDKRELAGLEKEARGGGNARLTMSVADGYMSYGDYAKAAEFYRLALQRGGDAAVANTRLGMSLALAGQKAEAEAAFKAVPADAGPRARLAQYWLAWLEKRA